MPTREELNDHVARVARHGDRAAFAELFRYFAPRVKGFLARSGCSEAIAEELAQDTLTAVWRKAAMFNPAQAGASTWVFTIARNLHVDHVRRRVNHETGNDSGIDEAPEDVPSAEDAAHVARRERAVREALSRLPSEPAQLLCLSFFEEHPHSRIATEFGIPLGTVKTRIRSAMLRLRDMIDELEP